MVITSAPAVFADQPKPVDLAERFNNEGRELFGRGELEAAIKKFRAAIAIHPHARYFFNLCFVLNARYQLEAALGACQAVAGATGADDRLKGRAAELIEVIEKKRQRKEKPSGEPEPEPVKVADGEPVLESKPLPPLEDRPTRVATAPRRRYPPPVGNTGKSGAVRVVTPEGRSDPSVHFGLVAGFSFSSLSDQNADGSTGTTSGITAGAFIASSLSRIWVGQAELVYVQRGGGDGADISIGDNVRFDYLSLPLVGKLQLRLGRTGKLHFDLGLSLSVLVNSSEATGDVSSVDAGWLVGGGFTYHRRGGYAVIIDLRHESGLADVDTMDGESIRNKTWTLRLGYGF